MCVSVVILSNGDPVLRAVTCPGEEASRSAQAGEHTNQNTITQHMGNISVLQHGLPKTQRRSGHAIKVPNRKGSPQDDCL